MLVFLISVNSSPLDKMAAILQMTFSLFRCILVNEKFCILIQISLKFVPKGPIDNKSALVQVMAWRRPGNIPLSEPINANPVHWHIYAALGGDEIIVIEFLQVNLKSCINSSPPCATNMHHWTGSALFRVMVCSLFGAKPLPELMMSYCQLNP